MLRCPNEWVIEEIEETDDDKQSSSRAQNTN